MLTSNTALYITLLYFTFKADEIQLLKDEKPDRWPTSNTRYAIPSHSGTSKPTTNGHFADDELASDSETSNCTLNASEPRPLVQLRKYAKYASLHKPKHSEDEIECKHGPRFIRREQV